MRWRLILSEKENPYTNMAIDEAIFINYFKDKRFPVFRIYGWKPASLSIGYFQKAEEAIDLERCVDENISVVRRMTGGGIIFHDKELTYSLVCSKKDLKTDNIKESYKVLCSFIIKAYEKLGLDAHFAKDTELSRENLRSFSPFCFASSGEYDIIIDGKKIGGSAQRRRRDVIFQHGSIPFKLDMDRILYFLREPDFAMKEKSASLNDSLKREIKFLELKNLLLDSFKQTLSTTLEESALSEEEKNLADNLRERKYKTDMWNLYSAPAYRRGARLIG
jgi:lipoyl(octanoyl) transferase